MSTSIPDETKKESSSKAEPSINDDAKEMDSLIEGIDNLPTDTKKRLVKRMVVQEFGMMGVSRSPLENEVAKKLNETHITKYLDGTQEQIQKEYQERHERKLFTFALVFLALVFFIAVIILLKDSPDILEKIIYSVTGFLAGAFGGYGFGKHKGKDDD